MKKARPWRGRKNTKKEIRLVKPNPKCLISHECVSNLTVFIQPWDNMLHTGNFDLWSKLLHRASVYSSATGNCLIVNVLFCISALLCSKALYGDNVCFKWCDVLKKCLRTVRPFKRCSEATSGRIQGGHHCQGLLSRFPVVHEGNTGPAEVRGSASEARSRFHTHKHARRP